MDQAPCTSEDDYAAVPWMHILAQNYIDLGRKLMQTGGMGTPSEDNLDISGPLLQDYRTHHTGRTFLLK